MCDVCDRNVLVRLFVNTFVCPACGWCARILFQNFAAEVTNDFLKTFGHKDPAPGMVQLFCDEFEITDIQVVLAMNPCVEKDDMAVRCYMNLRQAPYVTYVTFLLSICRQWS